MPKSKLKAASESEAEASAPTKAKTKLALLADLLERRDGASVPEMMEATGWQAHSVRGALAGGLKKKGLTIASEKTEGARRYHIVKAAAR